MFVRLLCQLPMGAAIMHLEEIIQPLKMSTTIEVEQVIVTLDRPRPLLIDHRIQIVEIM